jgi:3-hydroxyacyl-CoA dehydrogenase/enoyl-CoA hydratase/3-hydroxybutyryl-CoA epimerase
MSVPTSPAPVSFEVDADGIGWIIFGGEGTRPPICNDVTLQALEEALSLARASGARAIIVTGTHERIFIAGADLHALQTLPDASAAEAFSRRGQLLFQQVADLPVPVVCAINGVCAGGGYELALACDWRMASNAPAMVIGLPEVSLGTLPGWGGCVRLPRLIGAEAAIDHILRAQLVPGAEAVRLGLIDELAPAAELRAHAKAAALRMISREAPRATPPPRADALFAQRRSATAKSSAREPAAATVVDLIARTHALPVPEALQNEAAEFGRVTASETCRNLIQVFFLREAARKRTLAGWFDAGDSASAQKPLRKVGVIGAGVMGSGIAHCLATRGCDVVMRDVQPELLDRALGVIRGLIDDGVKRGKTTVEEARLVLGRISPSTGWDAFADCDLVIEAIVENVEAKQRLFSELAGVVGPEALLASNTSALPIEEIAGHVPNPERVLGLHFFNPVSRMPLVELVLGRRTAETAAGRALQLLRRLGKQPVICRSSPGFLVTRVLFFYLNAAVKRWEDGVPTATIDGALRDFGWPMGPLRLIDEVGVDVTASIFGELAHYFPDRFAATSACDRLLTSGLKGRKNGTSSGFYRYAGREETLNESAARRCCGSTDLAGAVPSDPGRKVESRAEIISELMGIMVREARLCLAEGVVQSPEDVDFALLSGAGFPAFRGGLLRWADSEEGNRLLANNPPLKTRGT